MGTTTKTSEALEPAAERQQRLIAKAEQLEDKFRACGITFYSDNSNGDDPAAGLEMQFDIALRNLDAGSVEDVLSPPGTLSLKDHAGKPFVVTATPIARASDPKYVKPGQPRFYLQWNAAILDERTGEVRNVVMNTGSLSAMSQLAALTRQGAVLGAELAGYLVNPEAAQSALELRRSSTGLAGAAAVADAGDQAPY